MHEDPPNVPQIKPVSTSALSPPARPPPPARLIDGGPVHSVNKPLHVRRHGLGFWEGYGLEDRSWVPRSRILIRNFHRLEAPVEGGVPSGSLSDLLCVKRCFPQSPMAKPLNGALLRTIWLVTTSSISTLVLQTWVVSPYRLLPW